ncbi:MAG: tRNA lysidine(34) synthetase TilS [Actinomycetota bacterium]|nr:tRNA lysidine(34) synthetase TilS [Actinomycetota bacterium]
MRPTATPSPELLSRCRFPPPGTAATAAVSGGADSLALLVLSTAAGLRVDAVHVDHGLRPGSAAEADVVRDAAVALGADFRSERVVVEPGPNLEARARAARRAVLPADAMTGHTADDQAETLLLNLLRGAGLDGVAAMRPGPHKPLLGLRRAETHAVCREAGLQPVVDPSNVDPAFRRNRVRHEVLPLLDDVACREVVPLLARTSALAGQDAELLDALAAAVDARVVAELVAAPEPLARRALRRWLVEEHPPHPPSEAALERVLAVARGETVATDVGGGLRVARTGGRLRVERPGTQRTTGG